jgi:DNA replication protein DnaC
VVAHWLLRAVEPHPALMGPSPVPTQFHDVTVDGIAHAALRDCVHRYGEHFWQAASAGLGPLFLGAPARYKSFAAAVLTRGIHERACVPSSWCDVPVALNQMERRRFDRTTDELIESWKVVPWLVFDDFALVRPETWQHGVLMEVAMARFDARKPTCWTGNVELSNRPAPDAVAEALKRVAGVQLARRVLERSENYRVYVR